jgi:hypothetical protein
MQLTGDREEQQMDWLRVVTTGFFILPCIAGYALLFSIPVFVGWVSFTSVL